MEAHIQSLVHGYTDLAMTGRDTYYTSFKAKEASSGRTVTLKFFSRGDNNEAQRLALNEINILKDSNHPSIVKLIDSQTNEEYVVLVLEYLPMDLRRYISSQRTLPQELVRSYAFQILAGLYNIHQRGIIHRDLKPEKLLIDENGQLKISGFCCAKNADETSMYTHEMVSLWYRPPEMLLHNPEYNEKADLWSAGCVIAEMVKGRPLFMGDSSLDQMNKIVDVLGTPNTEAFYDLANGTVELPSQQPKDLSEAIGSTSDLLTDLLSKLLALDPNERITARDAINHPYFDEIRHNYDNGYLPEDFYQ